MLEATHKKLSEAKFFLEKFAAEERDILRQNSEAGEYYLSAFLAAARSAGDIVAAEAGDEYRRWWLRRKETLTDDERNLLRVTNQQRVATIHIRGVDVNHQSRTVPLHKLQAELRRKGGDLQYSHLPGTPAPTTSETWLAFAEYPNDTAVDICNRYLSLLSRLLQEYESHHLSSGP